MIIFHLKELLQQQKISQNEFARMTGIRPNTINDLVNNKTKRLEIATFNKILKVIVRWGYTLPDFIEYREKR